MMLFKTIFREIVRNTMAEFGRVYNQGRWYITQGNWTRFEIVSEIYSVEEMDYWVECLNKGAEEIKNLKESKGK